MIGDILASFALELVVYPAGYRVWKWNSEATPGLCQREATQPAG